MKSRYFYARHYLTILVIVAFCLPIIGGGALRALKSNHNDVAQWLPDAYEETARFKQFRQWFGGNQFILLSWEGCTIEDPRLSTLAEKLDPPPPSFTPEALPYFDTVVTGPRVIERLTGPPTNITLEQALTRLSGSLIGKDYSTTCAVLHLTPHGQKNLKAARDRVLQVAMVDCGIPLDDIHMGGPPIDNVAIDEAGERSLYQLAAYSGAIGLIVSWWCLRSLKLVQIVFATAIFSAGASLAIVWYSGSTMNAILLTMPPLVYVAAASGAIHLANYYRDTVKEGDPLGAPGRAVQHAALPLTLATITTAVGLVSLAVSELKPIQQFGIFSALGVTASAMFLVFFLPAILQVFPPKFAEDKPAKALSRFKIPDPMASRRWRILGRGIIRHYIPVGGACLLALGIGIYGISQIHTSVHLMRMFDSKARILADYAWLEQNLGELVPMEIVVEVDQEHSQLTFLEQMELIARVHSAVESVPDVGSALSTITFSPPMKIPALNKIPNRGFAAITRKTRNKQLLDHLDQFLGNDYLRSENGKLLWRISARIPALREIDYTAFDKNLKEKVEPVLAEYRDFLKARHEKTAERNQAAADSPNLADADNAGIVAAASLAADADAANATLGVRSIYTGLVPLVYKAQNSLLQGLYWGFIGDLIVVTLVMIFAVRDWSAGLVLALPSIFPAVIVFGVMGLLGIVVDVGTVMTPSVALGVTVDDVVHYLLWYRTGVRQGLTRHQAIMLANRGCARAMYQSWGVIGLGLSVFALSPFQPTQRFGYLMISLLSASLIGNLILLPALLATPLGRLFARRERRLAEADRKAGRDPAAHAHGAHADKVVAAQAEVPHKPGPRAEENLGTGLAPEPQTLKQGQRVRTDRSHRKKK